MNRLFTDVFNAQLVQNLLSVKLFEEYGCRYVVEAPPGKAIDMRHHSIDVFLREVFQISPFGDHFAKVEMIIFRMSLLPGKIGIAVKDSRAYFP